MLLQENRAYIKSGLNWLRLAVISAIAPLVISQIAAEIHSDYPVFFGHLKRVAFILLIISGIKTFELLFIKGILPHYLRRKYLLNGAQPSRNSLLSGLMIRDDHIE